MTSKEKKARKKYHKQARGIKKVARLVIHTTGSIENNDYSTNAVGYTYAENNTIYPEKVVVQYDKYDAQSIIFVGYFAIKPVGNRINVWTGFPDNSFDREVKGIDPREFFYICHHDLSLIVASTKQEIIDYIEKDCSTECARDFIKYL